MRILVTGGTGYLGRAVGRALHRAGHDVVLYGRTATSALPDLVDGREPSWVPASAGTEPRPAEAGRHEQMIPSSGGRLTAHVGDIRDAATLEAAARGCDAIVHMAALVAVWRRRARDFDDTNVGGLRHVLDAARVCGLRRVVYTSSFLALPPAPLDVAPAWNDYQRTKAAAERLAVSAVDAGAPLVRLYPGVVYGPGLLTDGNLVGRQIADHLAGRLPGVVGADRIWSFSYVEDVAAAHVAAVERGRAGAQYPLGGVDAPQMRAFEIVRTLTGRPLPRRLPAWLVAAGALADELRAGLFGGTPLVTTGTLEILLRDWPLGCAIAREELGYTVTPLEQGIGAIVSQLRGAQGTV